MVPPCNFPARAQESHPVQLVHPGLARHVRFIIRKHLEPEMGDGKLGWVDANGRSEKGPPDLAGCVLVLHRTGVATVAAL